ncbi:BTAD domain-containing putative transcriptional regulator [Saccharothrix xinjiangensis]|uniref:BTAD domain-containing putative transcriptional regulator n=1 Tax=Saccharothrix xinjiangensis TaxID=204798 RepID=A0ABV9Y9F2_9PSEU
MSTTASLVVRLLGPVRAWRNGSEVDLGTARRRAVFTLLAVRANEAVSKDELVDGVWGDAPPASAEAGLYTYISGLRRVLEPERSKRSAGVVLTSSGAGYALRLDREQLDVHRFDRHRERAEALARQDPDQALAELDAALALWEGEALFAVPGRFAETQRSRLHELRLAAVERRAELALLLGRHTDVVAELSALVVEHPLREGLHALLMTALHRSGRQAEALEVFRDARRVLATELGIEPGHALRELHQQVLTGDAAAHRPADTGPPPATPAGSTPAGSTPAGSTQAGSTPDATPPDATPPDATPAAAPPATGAALPPFVGRRRELDLLRRAVSGVAGGRGGVAWLEGEPGIGKSSLLTACLADAPAAGVRVARAAADELGGRFPLRVALDALDVSVASADPRRVELARDLLDPTRDSPDAGDPVVTAIDGLVELVAELCADTPLVLVLDDFQWADEASVLLWHRLLRLVHRLPLLLVAAARPVPHRDDVTRVRRAVVRVGDLVELGPLSGDEVTALLTALVGAAPGEGLSGLAGCVGGNPLYLREVVDALLRENAVEFRDGVAEACRTGRDMPSSLVGALTRRLAFLSADALDLLRRAALLGTGFAPGDAAVVAGRPVSELVAAVEEATAAGVLVEAGAEFTFRHHLIHRALYLGTPAAVRTALHRQAAQALAAAGSPVELVARQLATAPTAVDPWVVDWLVANAESVAARAPELAVSLMRSAIGQPDVPAGDRERLAARLARLVFRLGGRAEADTRYALARARDRDLVAELRWVLAASHHREGRAAEAAEVLRAAVADSGTPPVWRARLEALAAGVLPGEEAGAAAQRALRLAREVRDGFAEAQARRGLWRTATAHRDHREALRQVDLALTASVSPEVHADLVGDKVLTLQHLDRLTDADRLVHAARPHHAAAAQAYWRGRWAEALDLVDTHRAPSPGPWPRDRGPTPPAHGVAALVAARQDRVDVAVRHLRAAVEHRDEFLDDFLAAAEATLAERDGRVDDAVVALSGVLAAGRVAPELPWLPALTRLALLADDHRLAARAVERALADPRAVAVALRCRGLVDRDPAPVLDAAARYREAGRPVELAESLEDAAALLAEVGDDGAADAAVREAVALYRGFGAEWDARRAGTRLCRAA